MTRSTSVMLLRGCAFGRPRRVLGSDGLCRFFSSPQVPAMRYALLHHHKDPTLLQYREPGSFAYLAHHISSAIDAVISLCSSQEARNQFLSLTTAADVGDSSEGEGEGGEGLMGAIINTRVLGQSDMGFLKTLTLYHELCNPLFQQNSKFNVREFMDGCGWALAQFHRTKAELLPKLLTNVTVKRVESETGVAEANDKESDNRTTEYGEISSAVWFKLLEVVEVAKNNPDTVEGTFIAMTTPEVLGAMQMEGTFIAMTTPEALGAMQMEGIARLKFEQKDYATSGEGMLFNDGIKVMNVALLSLRVEQIYTPSPSAEQVIAQKKVDDPNAPLEDESLTPPPEENEPKAQIVTQLEVLYELQQSSVNDEGKTNTQTSVMVGKFEGCLEGYPNGNELRWKLASYRPAVEFYNTV